MKTPLAPAASLCADRIDALVDPLMLRAIAPSKK
jgi:hypothetical protein